jgi:hypothetical protein
LAATHQAKIALEMDAINEQDTTSDEDVPEAPVIKKAALQTTAPVSAPNDKEAGGAGKSKKTTPNVAKAKKKRKPTPSAYQQFGPLNLLATKEKGKYASNDLLCTFIADTLFNSSFLF